MSWAGIANNQCISWNNLKDAVDTGVFLGAENAVPPGSKQITRLEAQQYAVINPLTGLSNNQLPVKSDLVAKTGVYKWNISSNGTTSGAACALIFDSTVIAWTNTATPTTGTVFYDDYNLTTIFPMSGYAGLFLHYKSYGAAGNGFYARFNLATSTINNSPASC
jgi:hypothetical protein